MVEVGSPVVRPVASVDTLLHSASSPILLYLHPNPTPRNLSNSDRRVMLLLFPFCLVGSLCPVRQVERIVMNLIISHRSTIAFSVSDRRVS